MASTHDPRDEYHGMPGQGQVFRAALGRQCPVVSLWAVWWGAELVIRSMATMVALDSEGRVSRRDIEDL